MNKDYWHTMRSVDDVIVYTNRLGFGIAPKYRSPGWIVIAQIRLCDVYDALLAKAGSLPFDVHYSRKRKTFYVRVRKHPTLPRGSIDTVDAHYL